MKRKLTVLLLTVVVALGLLLGISPAEAQPEVQTDETGRIAHGILNLEVAGVLYNVAFRAENALDVYGDPPAFDFPLEEAADDAAEAVRGALNSVPTVEWVGPPGGTLVGIDIYNIYAVGFLEVQIDPLGEPIRIILTREVFYNEEPTEQDWERRPDPNGRPVADPATSIADFTLVDPGSQPDPVTIGGTVSGLVGRSLVLQNNDRDNETIDSDGEFTFDTPLTPGTFYDVTVAANPTSPGQTCSVANGSGQVPTENVTDVVVTCDEPTFSELVKVAAEGDTLPDSTVLTVILRDAGVAINFDGQVAFGGRDDDGTDAAFTQDRKVAAEGETLEDGTVLSTFRAQGEVAINAGQSGEKVAFHGQDDANNNSVFTQAGRVAAEGATLPDGTILDEIDDEGKVAINYFDQVAFHGRIKIEDGLFDEVLRAVFTSNGTTTQVVAQEGGTLPDSTTVAEILEAGGVAINDMGKVAFIGRFVEAGIGGAAIREVLTTDGLVARELSVLPDGNTLDDINEDGGVAINLWGEVAFHGSVLDPDAGVDAVKAVLTGEVSTGVEVIVKVGDTLPDGTTVDEITVHSGVAINVYGDVVFHGRTGNVKAVFTQHGLVAKVGDNLADQTTTLSEIWEKGGVAIEPYGLQVALHGGIYNPDSPGSLIDAVFVGLAP
jgi:hypothetical protein